MTTARVPKAHTVKGTAHTLYYLYILGKFHFQPDVAGFAIGSEMACTTSNIQLEIAQSCHVHVT